MAWYYAIRSSAGIVMLHSENFTCALALVCTSWFNDRKHAKVLVCTRVPPLLCSKERSRNVLSLLCTCMVAGEPSHANLIPGAPNRGHISAYSTSTG